MRILDPVGVKVIAHGDFGPGPYYFISPKTARVSLTITGPRFRAGPLAFIKGPGLTFVHRVMF